MDLAAGDKKPKKQKLRETAYQKEYEKNHQLSRKISQILYIGKRS